MNKSILELIARVIGWFEPLPDFGPGHPPAETVRVLATLRRFLREGTPLRWRRHRLLRRRIASRWRGLRATKGMASGSTLRRRLADWAKAGVLGHVHSMLVGQALSATPKRRAARPA